jgi:primosomal protein N' (replication factor Y)
MARTCILRVAVDTPLRKLFDYLPPHEFSYGAFVPGQRFLVPFGKNRSCVGLLVSIADTSMVATHKLKRVLKLLDIDPLFGSDHLDFLLWASRYYHHAIGEVILGNLPKALRNGTPALIKNKFVWRLTPAGGKADLHKLDTAPKQKAIVELLLSSRSSVTSGEIMKQVGNNHAAVKILENKGLIEHLEQTAAYNSKTPYNKIPGEILNNDQKRAVTAIISARNHYQPFLLNGVTGSGKTEVYIHSIAMILHEGRQALVLLPEIGLTPQFIERIRRQFGTGIAVLHSALSDKERLRAWLMARDGKIKVIVGTRSALWTPFKNLGIIIIDEEHDLSYKQQEGFRYSARDMAIARAQREDIPVVLGSATPSLESILNVSRNRYLELHLPERAGNASMPDIKIIDLRNCRMDGAVSLPLLEAVRNRLEKKEQVLLFLNRRGYAPVLMCHECGWVYKCPRCDIQMTYHKHKGKLCCHHCAHEENRRHNCPGCDGSNIAEIGHGTQRLTETLAGQFPGARILRIDRDSTRRKDAMQNMMEHIQKGDVDILIGTQMLAKGHHFPGVTLAGIIDADRGLYSVDYRASERMGQIIMQVSGRAGRSDKAGTVLIQTHHPEHPLLQTLAQHDYARYTSLLIKERREAGLPPFSHQVLLRAEAKNMPATEKFLQSAHDCLPLTGKNLEIFGPLPAPMEKRAGYYRMQLLVQSQNRARLRGLLDEWIPALEQLPEARKVRWSIDVDPQDLL